MPSIFVSYKRSHAASDQVVQALERELGNDFELLRDQTMQPGARWTKELYAWLLECDVGIAIVSHEANTANANLTNANLTNANLTNANLTNANLTNANLTNANLANANLANANLTNANLTNANLTNGRLPGANFFQARLRGTKVYQWSIGVAKHWATGDGAPIYVGAETNQQDN